MEHVRDAALRALARPTLRAAEGLEVTWPRIFVRGHLSPEECACRLRHWPPVVTPPMPSEQPAPMLALGSPKRIDVAAVPLKNPACRQDYCWRSWGNATQVPAVIGGVTSSPKRRDVPPTWCLKHSAVGVSNVTATQPSEDRCSQR